MLHQNQATYIHCSPLSPWIIELTNIEENSRDKLNCLFHTDKKASQKNEFYLIQ